MRKIAIFVKFVHERKIVKNRSCVQSWTCDKSEAVGLLRAVGDFHLFVYKTSQCPREYLQQMFGEVLQAKQALE